MTIDPQTFSWEGWQFKEQAVLAFLIQGDQILLIHKLRGLGQGKVNGPGGRLEPGETFLQAAIRETQEETGVILSDLVETAELQFVFVDGYSLYARVFLAYNFTGELRASDEADPFWCPLDQIPYDQMWSDDRLWLPQALAGSYVRGRFIFDGDTMCTQDVTTERRDHGKLS